MGFVQVENIIPLLCTYQCQGREWEGGRGRATHGNLTVAYIPRVWILIGHQAFDILYSRREVNHLFLLILTILFRPGMGILIIFFTKCQNPHPMPPPPSGLTLTGALTELSRFVWENLDRGRK